MRRIQFANGGYYHVYNRGVDKRTTFESEKDYVRFLFHLYACNDRYPLLNSQFHYRGLASIERPLRRHPARSPLVDILCFCLMPNHFHLLLRQIVDAGISDFLQKAGTAYTMYFNTKYNRSGALFQGPYQARHIATDEYFLPLTRYIHLNPLDLIEPRWRERGIRHPQASRDFLYRYAWSSYPDYLDEPRFPGLLDDTLLRRTFGAPSKYRAYVERWQPHHAVTIAPLTIEAKPL